ncbi:MAG: RIP metalloprotease RseP [Hungatella sp.]|nr:RIP metalloprotease RseP [Hungatella sp.]
MSIIVAVLVFGMIILIHEFGHFIVAKQCGIGVLEFSIGMGPRLFCVTRGETRYSIKIFPFGGSCMMLGEDENDKDPRAFNNKSVWARIAVIAAGPVFNFILAFFLALVIIHVAGHDAPRLTGVLDGMPAQEQGLEAGDLITKLNRERVVVYRDITMYMMLHPSDPVTVEYVRTLKDGRSETRTARLVPRYSEEYQAYMLGIQANAYREPVTGVADTVRYGAYEVVYWVKTAIKSIQMMFRGQVKPDDIAGPVRMVSIIDETVEENRQYGMEMVLLNLINLCVLLSANLGVMNLLPIPALDGGRLAFLAVEAVRGKPIDKEKEGMVHMAGMVLLMGLMVFVLFNDIALLFFRK